MGTTGAAHRWRRLPLVLGTSVALAPAAIAQQPDSTAPPVVVECRLGGVASSVMEGRIEDGALVLPVRPVLALVGLDSTSASGERRVAELSALLGADIAFDTAALVVRIVDNGTLPASRRALRARSRARLADEHARAGVRPRVAPTGAIPSAASVSYRLDRTGAASVTTSTRALWGVVHLTTSRLAGHGTRSGVSWTSMPSRRFGGARLQLGTSDELASGSGIVITNAPLERADTLGSVAVDSRISSGIERELFVDDVLVAADSGSEGRSPRLEAAERRGIHAVHIISYDSTGAARVYRWVDYVPEALLPRRALRYTLSSRPCWSIVCGARAADLAYAPSSRATIAARVARWNDGMPHRFAWSRSVSLDTRVTRSTALSLRVTPEGSTFGELRVERGHDESLVLQTGDAVVAGTVASIPASVVRHGRVTTASGVWRIGARGTIDVVAGRAGSTDMIAVSGGAASTLGAMHGDVSLSDGRSRCADVSGVAMMWGARFPRALAMLRAAVLSLRADRRTVGCGAASSGVVALFLPGLRSSALGLAASWEHTRAAHRSVVLSLALRRTLGGIADADVQFVGRNAARSVRSTLSGSLTVDALDRSVVLARASSDGTSGVRGVVYADENENGRRDGGERAVSGALVRVGEASAVSDERGVFVVGGLPSDRTVRVAVDSLSVEEQGYAPGAVLAVLLVSSAVARVDVPLRSLREPVP